MTACMKKQNGREQRVVINGSNSNWLPLRAGAQGSIIGPLLLKIL